jgi:hypothetical protein
MDCNQARDREAAETGTAAAGDFEPGHLAYKFAQENRARHSPCPYLM